MTLQIITFSKSWISKWWIHRVVLWMRITRMRWWVGIWRSNQYLHHLQLKLPLLFCCSSNFIRFSSNSRNILSLSFKPSVTVVITFDITCILYHLSLWPFSLQIWLFLYLHWRTRSAMAGILNIIDFYCTDTLCISWNFPTNSLVIILV